MTTRLTTDERPSGIIRYRGVELVRRSYPGPRGGTRHIYQAAEASRTWGYWYDTASEAAAASNSSDRVVI